MFIMIAAIIDAYFSCLAASTKLSRFLVIFYSVIKLKGKACKGNYTSGLRLSFVISLQFSQVLTVLIYKNKLTVLVAEHKHFLKRC